MEVGKAGTGHSRVEGHTHDMHCDVVGRSKQAKQLAAGQQFH